MCQLLGMSCNVPTDICFSFTGFCRRGGGTDQHSDGWGIAFFEGAGCRLFLDPAPAVNSPVAELVRRFPIRSLNVIAHIRKATRGPVGLENTHPFMRELWGRYWIFAHNGTLQRVRPRSAGVYRPVGGTDSEAAFCLMLDTLRETFASGQPPLADLVGLLGRLTVELERDGTFNYLLSNGEYLFAYCSDRLCYLVRQAPFSTAHLVDEEIEVDFSQLTAPTDRVAVIATQPLTDNEQWSPLVPGELAVFADGLRVGVV